MVQFLPLPQFQTSPLLDLSPITNALQRNRQAELQQIQMQRQAAQDRATLAQIRSQTGLNDARAAKARTKDEMDSALAGLIRSAMPQQSSGGASQPGQGPIRPQSFEGGGVPQSGVQPVVNGDMPLTDPNVIRTQTTAAGSQPEQPQMVDTPLGPMSQEQARKLGLGLMLGGKGDAGKFFVDEANKGQLAVAARNKLDADFIDSSASYQRLRDIQSSLDPKYLEWSTRINMWGKSLAAKAGNLNPKDQEELYKYSTFRRDAASNLNLLVKERSGGAVTPQEFQRQGVEIPNAGNGVFDGDDPVTFKAKLDRAYEVVALGMARNAWLRKSDPTNAGKSVAELSRMMPIERMRAMINARAQNIEAEVARENPGLHKSFIDREVDRRVKAEFGI
jgi:hypothetical protein